MPHDKADSALKPRVTINVAAGGELEIFLNESGRDLLITELLDLSERNDHFHLWGWEDSGADVQLSMTPYRQTDKVIDCAKVLFRPDAWDREYFPHVVDVAKTGD